MMERCRSYSDPVQVGAAAEVKENDELRGGGSAQTSRCVTKRGGRRRRKERKMERGLPDPIYKEKGNRRARKTRRPKNDYPTDRMPRFLGWILKIMIC